MQLCFKEFYKLRCINQVPPLFSVNLINIKIIRFSDLLASVWHTLTLSLKLTLNVC